jgi:hypothetical protein
MGSLLQAQYAFPPAAQILYFYNRMELITCHHQTNVALFNKSDVYLFL